MTKNDKCSDIWPAALGLAEKVHELMKVEKDWEIAFNFEKEDEQTLLEELYKKQTSFFKVTNYVEKGDKYFLTTHGKKQISGFLTVKYRSFYKDLDNPYSNEPEPYRRFIGDIIVL